MTTKKTKNFFIKKKEILRGKGQGREKPPKKDHQNGEGPEKRPPKWRRTRKRPPK